jgi:hypothetical protein
MDHIEQGDQIQRMDAWIEVYDVEKRRKLGGSSDRILVCKH